MTEKLQGAEAEIEIKDDTVVKKRSRKRYRHPELDERLRKERTETEERLIMDARKYGVKAPEVEMMADSELEIEKVEGETLNEHVEDNPELLRALGENVAYLHSTDIIHGDLTTSNAMVEENTLILIDFGLSFRSQRLEDRAVDIHLLKQVLETSHPEIAGEGREYFIEGYREYERSYEVLEQLEEVEKRGRYK
jgi:Kae1-associated kinase Bud32